MPKFQSGAQIRRAIAARDAAEQTRLAAAAVESSPETSDDVPQKAAKSKKKES